MRAFLPPSFLVVKAIFWYDGYKSFWPCLEESVWGFLAPTQITLYCKAAECIWRLLLGFQKYLYAHLCFDLMFVSFGSHCSFLPVFILIHGPLFQSVQIFIFFFFGSSRIYCSNCANCNGLFRSYMSRKTTITYSLYM